MEKTDWNNIPCVISTIFFSIQIFGEYFALRRLKKFNYGRGYFLAFCKGKYKYVGKESVSICSCCSVFPSCDSEKKNPIYRRIKLIVEELSSAQSQVHEFIITHVQAGDVRCNVLFSEVAPKDALCCQDDFI